MGGWGGGRETNKQTHSSSHQGGDGQIIEDFREHVPHFDISILGHDLVIEAVHL